MIRALKISAYWSLAFMSLAVAIVTLVFAFGSFMLDKPPTFWQGVLMLLKAGAFAFLSSVSFYLTGYLIGQAANIAIPLISRNR